LYGKGRVDYPRIGRKAGQEKRFLGGNSMLGSGPKKELIIGGKIQIRKKDPPAYRKGRKKEKKNKSQENLPWFLIFRADPRYEYRG